MSEDRQTLDVYDAQAAEYEARVAIKDTPGLDGFIAELPPHAHVLDLGCGPGLTAKQMMNHGLTVDATDGSTAMVKRARDHGVPARQALFHQIDGHALYDGVFANFSLLHLPRAEMPVMLTRLHKLLKSKGILHIGVKLGMGDARDDLGRFYTYYQQDELEELLTSAGFTLITRILGKGTGLDGRSSNWIVLHAHS
ncbi:class I SAM-dependent methyltransferase [Aliiroseovarius sp. S1123]|jgi:predicted TPR repeat methyltransferase|uniref:class I SAM-dependent DNA methyltransferase n=1 Tax=unclassified Aliiroseovarius TaxID=2623558 RepID=UPI001FF5BDE2|nr:class I SAM-dependent methyltransferase [Aliiroseovarius sp. S1123]MCK0171690.1 class I SAM-dependent methyltransferase [Aliiroseovarius sp. S1123]